MNPRLKNMNEVDVPVSEVACSTSLSTHLQGFSSVMFYIEKISIEHDKICFVKYEESMTSCNISFLYQIETYSVIAIAMPVFAAFFFILSLSTSTSAPVAAREAVPKRTSLPSVVIGRVPPAVPTLRLLSRASLILVAP